MKKIYDFWFGVLLLFLSCWLIRECFWISADSGNIEVTQSPAMMPMFLSWVLLAISALMVVRSLLRYKLSEVLESAKEALTGGGGEDDKGLGFWGVLTILALYTFFLLPTLPFRYSTFIFLMLAMLALRAGSLWKIAGISICSVGLIQLVFGYIFRVPLP